MCSEFRVLLRTDEQMQTSGDETVVRTEGLPVETMHVHRAFLRLFVILTPPVILYDPSREATT